MTVYESIEWAKALLTRQARQCPYADICVNGKREALIDALQDEEDCRSLVYSTAERIRSGQDQEILGQMLALHVCL